MSKFKEHDKVIVINLDNDVDAHNLGLRNGLVGTVVNANKGGLRPVMVKLKNNHVVGFSEDELELLEENDEKHIKVDHTELFDKIREGTVSVDCSQMNSTSSKLKSDGGSSAYYFNPLPKDLIEDIVEKGGIEIKDIVKYCFYNDADCKDIIKAIKRVMEDLRGGGKEGVDANYDMNKIKFFVDELGKTVSRHYNEEKE